MASQQGGGGRKTPDYSSYFLNQNPLDNPWDNLKVLAGSLPGAYKGAAPGKNYNPGHSGNDMQRETDARRKAARLAAGKSSVAGNPAGSKPAASADPGQELLKMMLSGTDMAHNEFSPLYDLLDNQRKQATDRYTKAGNDVGGMYDALSKQIYGQEGGIKKNYADAGRTIGGAYNDAINATKDSFSDSRNDVAAIARRLGVEQAVPAASQDSVDQQNRLVGLLAANSANQQGVNALLGNNEVDYNRNEGQVAGLAGANARADFKGRLLDALNGLDNKQLELRGQEAGKANEYDMSIQKMQQDAEAAKAKMQQNDEYKRAGLAIQQGRLSLDNDKFLASQAPKPADPKSQSAYEALAGLANRLYPNTDAARNASAAIEDTFRRGAPGADTRWTDANEFIRDVLTRNKNAGDYRQLEQLALEFYTRLAGGANKEFGTNPGMG